MILGLTPAVWRLGLLPCLLFMTSTLRAEGLSIEWQVATNTLEWPEVHVLLTNSAAQEMFFAAQIGHATCTHDGRTRKRTVSLSSFWGLPSDGPRGNISPGKWNHRSFRLGSDPSLRRLLPCTLEAWVTYGPRAGKWEESTRRFELNLLPRTESEGWEHPAPGKLVDSTLVEATEEENTVIIRILIRNPMQEPIRAQQLKRRIDCASGSGAEAWFDLSGRVIDGERGPLYVQPNGWGVLLESVLANNADAFRNCVATIELGGKDGVSYETVVVPLVPEAQTAPLVPEPAAPPPR